MKKLLTLILLFTITLYSIPTQAFTLDGNDIPLVQTKNLFDKDTNPFELGGVGSSGNEITNSIRARNVGFIPVNSSTQYIFSFENPFEAIVVNYYTSSNSHISQDILFGSAFTTPSNAVFIRITARNTSPANATITSADLTTINNTAQLEEGNTATSYAPFGFLTLNDIFDDGNILLNSDFSNGSTNWDLQFATGSVNDNIFTYTPTGNSAGIFQAVTMINSNQYFMSSNVKSQSNSTIISVSGAGIINHTGSNTFETLNNKFTWDAATASSWLYRIRTNTFDGNDVFVSGVKGNYLLNLTTLGITHLSNASIENFLNDYLLNNAFIEGFAAGFAEGFDDGFADGLIEGFDNGVASETSFAVGFAQGLLQGGDMETGSSLLILIVALIGFGMMIFGFITKRGIFNLLSVAAFIVLGGLLAEFIGFIIITFALVFINVYYAFFGDL